MGLFPSRPTYSHLTPDEIRAMIPKYMTLSESRVYQERHYSIVTGSVSPSVQILEHETYYLSDYVRLWLGRALTDSLSEALGMQRGFAYWTLSDYHHFTTILDLLRLNVTVIYPNAGTGLFELVDQTNSLDNHGWFQGLQIFVKRRRVQLILERLHTRHGSDYLNLLTEHCPHKAMDMVRGWKGIIEAREHQRYLSTHDLLSSYAPSMPPSPAPSRSSVPGSLPGSLDNSDEEDEEHHELD